MNDLVFKDLGTSQSDQTWFIAWIGSINHPILNGSATINILLYPLKKQSTKSTFSGNPGELEFRNYKIRKVDVGLLARLRLGQLIKKDKIVGHPKEFLTKKKFPISIPAGHQYQILPVRNFIIDVIEKKKLEAPASIQHENVPNERLVKYNVYDFPLIIFNNSMVVCLRKGVEQFSDYDLILIPCIESLGFYFCTSDNLAQELFTGGLHHTPNTLFDYRHHVNDEKIKSGATPHVHLRYRIPDNDHKVVGRIAYSPEAMRAAKAIYNPLRKGSMNSSYLDPVSFFPFKGDAELNVCGREIKAKGSVNEYSEKNIFLVYNILNCTGKFPFDTINFTRENSGEQADNDGDLKPSNWNPKAGYNDNGDDNSNKDINAKSEGPPGKNSRRVTINELDERFLHAVISTKLKKNQQTTHGTGGLPPGPPTDDYTTVPEAEGDGTTGGLDLTTDLNNEPKDEEKNDEREKSEDKDRTPARSKDKYEEHFREVLKIFNSNGECTLENLSLDGSEYICFQPQEYLMTDPINFNFRSKSFKWATGGWTKGENGKWQWTGKRSAMAIRIQERKTNKKFILIDVFKTENEKSKSGFPIFCAYNEDHARYLTHSYVNQMLMCFALNEGVWLSDTQLKEVERKYINHFFEYQPATTYNNIVKFLKKFGFTLMEVERS